MGLGPAGRAGGRETRPAAPVPELAGAGGGLRRPSLRRRRWRCRAATSWTACAWSGLPGRSGCRSMRLAVVDGGHRPRAAAVGAGALRQRHRAFPRGGGHAHACVSTRCRRTAGPARVAGRLHLLSDERALLEALASPPGGRRSRARRAGAGARGGGGDAAARQPARARRGVPPWRRGGWRCAPKAPACWCWPRAGTAAGARALDGRRGLAPAREPRPDGPGAAGRTPPRGAALPGARLHGWPAALRRRRAGPGGWRCRAVVRPGTGTSTSRGRGADPS